MWYNTFHFLGYSLRQPAFPIPITGFHNSSVWTDGILSLSHWKSLTWIITYCMSSLQDTDSFLPGETVSDDNEVAILTNGDTPTNTPRQKHLLTPVHACNGSINEDPSPTHSYQGLSPSPVLSPSTSIRPFCQSIAALKEVGNGRSVQMSFQLTYAHFFVDFVKGGSLSHDHPTCQWWLLGAEWGIWE